MDKLQSLIEILGSTALVVILGLLTVLICLLVLAGCLGYL